MSADEQTVMVEGHRLRLTNLDKVMYPETGTTKGEVIAYVSEIAPAMLPHIAGRPVTRLRWVHGVGTADDPQPSFFAKDLEGGAPAWLRRRPIDHSGGAKDYPVVDDLASLVYLAQVASLELHVPQWRFAADGGRSRPDRLVLDLDPGDGVGLAECAEVARSLRAVLADLGLEVMPVTSGSKGMHLYASLNGQQTGEQITAFAKELAQAVEADHPDLVVSRMTKSARHGRVFIDWSQNNGAKTTIAPYSLRGRLRPTVAAPRTWAELDDPQLRQLEFHEVLERFAADGDLLAGIDRTPGPLAAYLGKRSAGRTPEPVPADAGGSHGTGDVFVIQEHHASALHWDLRLERGGVLVSWAVPKGVPPTSARNNLAVQTEDHPLSYATFEGVIPRGEYGAGRMWIWDTGTYELEKWRDDEVIATLHGSADGPLGSVRIALLRTDGAGEKSTWLLHRMKTRADGTRQSPGEPVVARSDEDPPADSPSVPPISAAAPDATMLRPMLAAATTLGLARDAARRAASAGEAPWVEFKWDGVRAIGVWREGRLRLYARSGTDITHRYPELTGDGRFHLAAASAIVDGEIVALDTAGRPSFSRLQNRMHLTKPHEIERERARTPAQLYLFDVTEVDGADLATVPLSQRRDVLERIAADAGPSVRVPPVFDDVDAALEAARAHALEGVMVKDPRSRYRRGDRSEDWLKLKITHTQKVVIGGVRPGKGDRAGSIGSLLMGVWTDDGLSYAGRVGSGFSESEIERLLAWLGPLGTGDTPFIDVPALDASDAIWVRPQLVGEVEFADWSPNGHLRHARWRGLRSDIDPTSVRRVT